MLYGNVMQKQEFSWGIFSIFSVLIRDTSVDLYLKNWYFLLSLLSTQHDNSILNTVLKRIHYCVYGSLQHKKLILTDTAFSAIFCGVQHNIARVYTHYCKVHKQDYLEYINNIVSSTYTHTNLVTKPQSCTRHWK